MNDEEFTRRVEVCNHEKTAVEARLGQAVEYADKLKAIGVTRTSATFLVVIGFLSLAGTGNALSSLISERQPGESMFSLLLRHLISLAQQNIRASWLAVALVLVVPVVIAAICVGLLIFYGVLRLVDRWVTGFDPTWAGSKRGQRRVVRSKPPDQFTGLISQLAGLSSKFGAFTNLEIERTDYAKLLASFPYLLIGGVIFFLFSGVALNVSNGDVAINLATTLIGVTVVLVATSFWIVYITNVIEPRWLSAAEGDRSGKNGVIKQLWLNRELSALLFLLILAIGLAGVLPVSGSGVYFNTSQYKHIVWGFVALFLAFGSLGLAYGVIQRGIFRDVDFLSRKRDSYRYWIERYSAQPTIEDESTYLDDLTETPISIYLEGRAELYRSQMSYELNEIFGDDFVEQQPPASIQKLWRRLVSAKSSSPSLRLKKSPPDEPRLIDYTVAPKATSNFISSKSEMARIEQRKTDIGQEIRKLESDLTNLTRELNEHRTSLTQCRREMAEAVETKNRKRSSVIEAREKELMKFRAEFAVGSICRDILGDEPQPKAMDGPVGGGSNGGPDGGSSSRGNGNKTAPQTTAQSVLV